MTWIANRTVIASPKRAWQSNPLHRIKKAGASLEEPAFIF